MLTKVKYIINKAAVVGIDTRMRGEFWSFIWQWNKILNAINMLCKISLIRIWTRGSESGKIVIMIMLKIYLVNILNIKL